MKNILPMIPVAKKISLLLFVMVFLLPLSARSEIKAGSVEITPFGGYNFFENRQNLENSPLIGGRLGYNFTKYLGIEGTWSFMKTYVDDKSLKFTREGQFTSPINDVNITQFNLGLVYHFLPEGIFNPYIVGGYGVNHYSPKNNNKNMSVIDFGLGAKIWMTDHIALRVDVRDNLILEETIHNVETTLGVVFAFGGESNAAAVPVDGDSDGDGVPDSLDKCPATPAGVAVDKDGCPLDSDKDGVPDYLDKCPGTPAGVAVDKDGCPPVAKRVVILASEPKVEEKVGAVVTETKEEKVVILAFEDVHFDFDQSTLKPEAKILLKKNLQTLRDNPKAKIRVAGYTSASGTEEYNQKLSERRAKAVQEYLISEGLITRDRLSTIGYGEAHPASYEAAPKDLYSDAAKSNMRVLFEIVVQ